VRLRLARSIAEIDAADWDPLFADGGPFVEHRFLSALEASGCVGAERGWQPMHALLEDGHGRLIAAAPLYLKEHSWGEFVFDFAWAEASHRVGRRYYPKWLCAVPFTPVCGARLGARDAAAGEALATALAACQTTTSARCTCCSHATTTARGCAAPAASSATTCNTTGAIATMPTSPTSPPT
jgi:Uncharacterized protein conserved in bacteria